MRRYRPDAVPVETRLLPASSRFTTVFDSLPGYSRWVPVVLNILKQPGTWAGSTRFIPDLQGCPRWRNGCDTVHHGSSRIIKPGWTGTLNRDSENGALRRNCQSTAYVMSIRLCCYDAICWVNFRLSEMRHLRACSRDSLHFCNICIVWW